MIQTCLLSSFLIFLPVLFFFIFVGRRRSSENNLKLPPSPPRLPFIGHLHQLRSLSHISLCALANKYGHIMLLQLGQVSTVVISSSELAKQVLKNQEHIITRRPPSKSVKLIYSGSNDIAFTPYGEHWRQTKKLCVTHLLNAKMVQSFQSMKQEEVDSMMNKISQLSRTIGAVNLSKELESFSTNVISRAVSTKFSNEQMKCLITKLTMENSKVFGAFNIEEFLPFFGYLRISGLYSRAKATGKRWSDFIDEIIKEHTKCGPTKDDAACDVNGDFVDVLLSLENNSDGDYSLTRGEIKAIMIDMFGAASVTPHAVIEYAIAELILNPKVIENLKVEVRGVTKGNPAINEEDLRKMSYLKAVIKETMRLHPPTPLLLPLKSTEICQLAGYHIPKKTSVLVNIWAIGRDPNVWEEPNKFKPERFIDSPIDFIGNDFQFIPFGAGRRLCPGIHFAVQNIELGLANLINKFDWAVPSNDSENGLNMDEKFGLVVCRAEKLCLVPAGVP